MNSRWLMLFALLLLGGCLSAPTEEPEHHIPAHKPASFPAAVERLNELHQELLDGAARSAEQLDAATEYSDVVRWLPELAADSDLEEEPWNRVDAAAALLQSLLRPVWEAGDRRAAYRQRQADVAELFAELDRVRQAFPAR